MNAITLFATIYCWTMIVIWLLLILAEDRKQSKTISQVNKHLTNN